MVNGTNVFTYLLAILLLYTFLTLICVKLSHGKKEIKQYFFLLLCRLFQWTATAKANGILTLIGALWLGMSVTK